MAYPPSGPPGYGPYGTPGGGYGGYGGPPGYGYGPPRHDHPQGTTILVLGICSLVVCALCGPFAWSMGNKAKRDIDRNPGAYSNESYVTIGRILGMVASGLLALQLVFGIIWLVFVFGIIGASSTSGY